MQVPLLGPDDALAHRPRRLLVAGPSGSGKTTAARRLATAFNLTHTEIDALFHGPDWTPRTAFLADVQALVAGEDWVTEWQYPQARPLLAARTDLVIWLDLPRRTVMRQVIGRTLRRRLHRERLWNGNVEPPLATIFTDPEHIVRWAWTTHGLLPGRIAALRDDRPELVIVRISRHRELTVWLDQHRAR